MRARRLITTALAAMTAALTLGTLGATPAGAVANGTQAQPGQYPFAAKLTMTGIPTSAGGTRDSACSAALVAASWIITAGHCFHDATGKRVSGPVPYPTAVNLGTVNLDQSPGEERTVVEVRQSTRNDIALARLDTPVESIAPVPLNTSKPARREILTLAGWGATSSDGPSSSVLMTGQVKVGAVKPTTVLVTGYLPFPDTSACPYDSGAPYIVDGPAPVLVSVENTGPNCPHSSQETTARVDVIATWIRSVTAAA